MNKGEIIIYSTPDGQTALDVHLEEDTVWLTQAQMSELFQTTPQNITLHIGNVFKEKELQIASTCKDYLHVRMEGKRTVQRLQKMYNLDVIISVGYRVKSNYGTQFRIWANSVLKDYLVKGYAINQKAKLEQLEDLKKTIKLLSSVVENHNLSPDETSGLFRVITDYTYGLDTLDKYDFQKLEVENTTKTSTFRATYEDAMKVIVSLKDKFGSGGLFGNEKDESFDSSINTIYQTFDGVELYPSIEEKAAMLLYLVTKNHSFSDGNKRIAAFLFLWFFLTKTIFYTVKTGIN